MSEEKTTEIIEEVTDTNDEVTDETTTLELTPEELGIDQRTIEQLLQASNVVKVFFNKTECDRLEGLQMDLEATKSLIAFMNSTDCPYKIDSSKMIEYTNTYNRIFREHQVLMNHIADKYKPEGFSDYDFNITFRDNSITYVAKQ